MTDFSLSNAFYKIARSEQYPFQTTIPESQTYSLTIGLLLVELHQELHTFHVSLLCSTAFKIHGSVDLN